MKKQKFNYNTKDSGAMYFWLVVGNLVLGLIFTTICGKIASDQGITINQLIEKESVTYISMLITQILYFGIFLFYNFVNRVDFFTATKVKTKPNWIMILISVALGLVCLFGFNYFIGLCDFIILKVFNITAGSLQIQNTFWSFLLCTVLVAVLPAIVEEFIFRGVIFNGLKSKLSLTKAVLLASLIFALMHMSISQFIYQFALGVLLCLVSYITGSIIYGMVIHFVNNFTVLIISFVDSTAFTNTNWGFWEVFGSIGLLLAGLSLIIFLLKVLQKYCKKQKAKIQVANENSEIENTIKQSEGLSEYEIRQQNPSTISGKAMVIISLVLGILIWALSVFS